ncbi:MAG: SdiA-regulated domain-containing protein [Candidatus Doudnabacteria bacterium]|nr:SdiA-regulated domain-containing protein [Candidatus Doudnabacteria bacterium]
MNKPTFLSLALAASVFVLPRFAQASTAWPASSVAAQTIRIEHADNYEPSGLLWNDVTRHLFTVSDDGKITRMQLDGTEQETRILSKAGVGRDFEAITQVDPEASTVYIGLEHPDSILEYNWDTQTFAEKQWDLTSVLTGANNQGLEGLTFVPNAFVPEVMEPSASGGLFYAAVQRTPVPGGDVRDDYLIYAFDIDLSQSGQIVNWWGIPVPAGTPTNDVSDLSFNPATGLIYVLYDGPNRLVELTPAGEVVNDYEDVPTADQEGVVVLTDPPNERVDVYFASDSQKSISRVVDYPVVYPEPEREVVEVSNDQLVTHMKFDTNAADVSGRGHHGVLRGDASLTADGQVNGALLLDGEGDYVHVKDSTDVNLGTHGQRSVSLWFNAQDVQSRQVLFEEGAQVRGLAMYLDAGRLYVSGWNTPANESGWQGTYLSTDRLQSNTWHHVVLTLDGDATLQEDVLRAYLDGDEFASGAGSQLWAHSGDIGLGAVNDGILFHDGQNLATGTAALQGRLDDVRIYNRSLTDVEVYSLYRFTEELVLPPEVVNDPLSRTELVMQLGFNEDMIDLSGHATDATSRNGARLVEAGVFGGAVQFDGVDDYLSFTDSALINKGKHDQRSVSLWFNPDRVDARQVLFEEGGTVRGLNIYIEHGHVYVAGWNEPVAESGWEGTYLDAGAVEAGVWQQVVLTLDGTSELREGALKAYLNGQFVAEGAGSALWSHTGDIGVGATNNDTKFASGDRSGTSLDHFQGRVDDVRVYNRVLSTDEVALSSEL